MALKGTIGLERSSAVSVYMGCVVGHTHFSLALLIYDTVLTLLLLTDMISQAPSSPDTSWDLTDVCQALLLPCSTLPPRESLGLFHALWTRICIMGKGCGLALLCSWVEGRSLRKKNRVKKEMNTPEKIIERKKSKPEFWLLSLVCLTKFMSTLYLIYNVPLT